MEIYIGDVEVGELGKFMAWVNEDGTWTKRELTGKEIEACQKLIQRDN